MGKIRINDFFMIDSILEIILWRKTSTHSEVAAVRDVMNLLIIISILASKINIPQIQHLENMNIV